MTGVPDPPIRVLVVDDHEVVRLGLRAFLDATPGVEPVGAAADGHEALAQLEALAARDARWVSLAMLGGSRLEGGVDIAALLYKRVRIEGSTLRSRDLEYQERLRDRLAEYVPDFESGKLRVFVDTVFPMEDIVKAHQLMEESKTSGKIICTVS